METGLGAATVLGPQFEMLGPQLDMVKVVTEGVDIPGFRKYGPHPIVARIYNNQEFKDSLNNWFDYHLAHEFSPDSMNYLLDEMAEELRPYMQEYEERSPYIGSMYGGWENAVEKIREFNNARPEYMRDHLLGLTDIKETTSVDDFKLDQNFPNPFNPATTIQYQIPKAGNVLIRIYNVLGQTIESFNRTHNSSGQYSIKWDANNYSSGLYFYSIDTDGYKDVKKMMLLK